MNLYERQVKMSLDNQFPLSECSPLQPISLCSVQRSHSDPVFFRYSSCIGYKRSNRSNGKRRVSPPRVLYFLQFFVRVGTAPTDLEILQECGTLGFNNTGDMGRTIETITLGVLRIPDKETGNCFRVKFP
ncbi:hypothetical protein Hanom_Chr07g00654451 [Helianthus anomalus]